jgi:hypothetical protein
VLTRGEGGTSFKGESTVGEGVGACQGKSQVSAWPEHGKVRQRGADTYDSRGSKWRIMARRPAGGRTPRGADHGPALFTHRNAQRGTRSTRHWTASACWYGQVQRRANVRVVIVSCARARVLG